ncbi:zinc finger protein 16 [Rhipicephalus sanguineus]|uniref:zinc finger protein 16 n=1 Tax=Rhipicephalus sanguineus TaxID=34632 RepID=UPI001893A97D|nr:zinc finger protein 16 [Rhipicephalus sanguineus]
MAAPSSLLLAFKAKIEESVALVPDMGAEEKLKAVQFWNVVSERLQQIVNDSAADINALALNMHGEDINVASLHDEQESQAKMAQPYIEAHGYRSENLYTEAVEEFDVTAASEGHQQELLALSAELEQVGSSQPSTQGNFNGVPLEQGSLDVSERSLSKDSTVLLISTQAEDCPADATFDVAHQQSHDPGVLSQHEYGPNSSLVLQMPAKSVNLVQNKDNSEQWQSCSEYAAKPKVQRKRRPSTRKANAKSSAKRGTTPGGKKAMGVSAATDQRPSGTASDIQLESTQGVETTEVIVVQTRKKPKKSKEEKDRQCKVCLKELPNNSSLTTHMWTHERPFACAECNARFSTKNNLVVHQRTHSGEKPYACNECNASFSTRGNLKRHVKTHTGVKPWKCSHCEQCFTEKKTLVAHMRRHTGEKPYQCEVCQRRFAQSGVLRMHMAVHLGQKSHLCEHCGKAFRQRSQLHLHMQRHQGLRRYSCNICPSKFLTKADMLRHERTHTGERPYVCSLCGKKFTRQQSLNEHTNRHYGIKPFECKYCDKTFAEMSACYKHIKLHSKTENGENNEGALGAVKTTETRIPPLPETALQIAGSMQSATSTAESGRIVPIVTSEAGNGHMALKGPETVVSHEAAMSGTTHATGVGRPAEFSAMDLLATASGF